MSARERLIKGFRSLSAIIYTLDIICSVHFAWFLTYLHLCVGSLCAALSILMLVISSRTPTLLVGALEVSHRAFFTWRGRFVTDLFIALLLFAMGYFGITMGVLTLFVVVGIRSLGRADEESFKVLFPNTKDPSNNGDANNDNSNHGADYTLA